MTEAVERVLELVGTPPAVTPTEVDWSDVAASLGVDDLPSDFKALHQMFGDGDFDELLFLLSPVAGDERGIRERQPAMGTAMRDLRRTARDSSEALGGDSAQR